jgi:predicted metal-binding membrane protein
MGVGPGTMGLSLAAFLALWVVMMTAMMFPSVAPMVVVWIRSISSRPTRTARVAGVAEFLCGYMVAWAAFGLLAYLALIAADHLVDGSSTTAKWVGAGIFLLAGLYQLTPLKGACLRHCRSPIGSLFHYAGFKGPAATSGWACITACTASDAVGVS